MSNAFGCPSISEELIEDIVRRILSVGSRLKIALFGSWARGNPRPDSDLDLLIIEESQLPRHKRAARYRRALLGAFPAKDIVVWTPAEVDEWRDVPNAFITSTVGEGRTLYTGSCQLGQCSYRVSGTQIPDNCGRRQRRADCPVELLVPGIAIRGTIVASPRARQNANAESGHP